METKTIYSKILDFQNNVEVIKKDAKNPHFKNTYATLNNILSVTKPILNALGLAVIQPIKDGKVYTIIIDVNTKEFVESYIEIAQNIAPQQIGSAITYYRRYTLTSLLGLEIDDDDDGNKASEPKFESTTHDKPWLNKFEKDKKTLTENWQNVIKALESKVYTIQQVESKYKLSKEIKSELEQILNK